MIYFENASYGKEGLNTHVMSLTMCAALSQFLDRDFYFDFELPSSTPPAFAFEPALKDKYSVLIDSPRSYVSQLLDLGSLRRLSSVPESKNRIDLQLLPSHFFTTETMKEKFEGSIIWDSFAIGRHGHTREELSQYDLVSWTHTKTCSPAFFFFLPADEKRLLLDSVKVRYIEEIESLASEIISGLGQFNAAHLRLGDFLQNYASDEYTVNVELFRDFAAANLSDRTVPVVLATDGLDKKQMLQEILPDVKLIYLDEFIFDEYGDRFLELSFTDFNVLSIIDQLVCAAADEFIGTFRSTFTSIIHRIRQERYEKKDFNFWPDARVAKQMSADLKIIPDRSGFFDWNRYSHLAPDHESAAWKCEWNHALTKLDV
jgi:hypothetical protein